MSELGSLAYLTKPFDPPALASLVPGAVVRADTLERPSTPRPHRALHMGVWPHGAVLVLSALVIANTRQVKLSWVVGSGHTSLVWIILAAAVLGWLLGILTSVVFRLRTRRRRSA